MKNRVDATIEFYFKGERYAPSSSLDLDEYMIRYGTLPPLYTILAQLGGIDPYSYQYEVMEQEAVVFSNPVGFVADYLNEGMFDQPGFEARWREERVFTTVQEIASRIMGVDDLAQHPDLRRALVEAYQHGQDTPR